MIDHAKSAGGLNELQARAIWADRCGMTGPDAVHLIWVVEHLAKMVDVLELATLPQLLERANPNRLLPFHQGETDFVKQWFEALMLTLMLARGSVAWLSNDAQQFILR